METPLKRLRLLRKVKLRELADAVGSNTGNISRIENGKQQSPELAEKIVKFFGHGVISEIEILYPERFPPPDRKQGRGKKRADVLETARG